MKNIIAILFCFFTLNSLCRSQLMVSKMLGKNADNAKLGYGFFTFLEIPLASDNKSLRIELLDFAYFAQKSDQIDNVIGYLSIRMGYKYVFSEDQTGFYLEPSAGYCRVVNSNHFDALGKDYGDGVAAALEAGYSLSVGKGGNHINLGLKYEDDIAGANYTCGSVGLRASFSFHLFQKRSGY